MDDLIPADLQPHAAGAEPLLSTISPATISPATISPAIASHLIQPHLNSAGCTRPTDLLVAAHRAPDLIGRDDELAALAAWMSGPAGVSARCIIGRAGTGKTRLAIELCVQAEAQGWSAGFLVTDAVVRADTVSNDCPVLAIVDRASASLLQPQLCRMLMDRARSSAATLRVLFLDRTPDEFWPGLLDIGLPADPPEPVRLSGLRSAADRDRLLRQTMARAARLSGAPICMPPAGAALDSGEPLHLAMAALLAPHHGVVTALAQPPWQLADRLAMLEFARLEQLGRSLHLDPLLVTHFVACITLQGGCTIEAAAALLENEAHCLGLHLPGSGEYVADCIGDALLGQDGESFAPVAPDLVGEAFIIGALVRHSPELQAGVIDRALHRARLIVADTLRRLVQDHAADDPAHAARAWLLQAAR